MGIIVILIRSGTSCACVYVGGKAVCTSKLFPDESWVHRVMFLLFLVILNTSDGEFSCY